MSLYKFKMATQSDLPKGGSVISRKEVAKANARLKNAMAPVVRSNQKKQRASQEKASRTVLTA